MQPIVQHPLYVFIVSLVVLWVAMWFGGSILSRRRPVNKDVQTDFSVIQNTVLTMLGLIIGFTFSMAIGRYDQRKTLEEGEANAIGTEYVRADLLPAVNAAAVRLLLKEYLENRIQNYIADETELGPIDQRATVLQNKLWAEVAQVAVVQQTPINALAAAGMNDVLNAQGYAQAASLNRIPRAAWMLLFGMAISANLLVGYGAHSFKSHQAIFFVLPFVVSLAFYMIADIDSPRGGMIRVVPQNLQILLGSMP